MATRQIKDAKDLNTNELIYFASHAGATYMSDGSTVEDRINNLSMSGGGTNGGNVDLTGYATETYVDNKVATKQDVISDLATIRSNASKGATAVQPNALATVATSGSYNDLTNKPTIPSAVTESTVTNWGFTKNTGTIRGISIDGIPVSTSGIAEIPSASTSAYGVTKLSTSTSSTSTTLAATASAVKSTYDLANGKQDKLVSGTNIKTINGETILGSGDITISGSTPGENDANVKAIETSDLQIDDISVNRQIINTTDTDITLINNNYYKKTDISSNITINLEPVENNTVTNYCIEFTTSSSGTTVVLPSTIKWLNGIAPTFENNYTYQISVVNNLGVCAKFA